MLKIGKRLRQLRMQKGYSQEYLAHELKMTQGNYCKLESDNHFPSAEVLEKLAALYQVSPEEFISSEGQTQIQYNSNHDSSSSANLFMIWQNSQKIVEELLATKEQLIKLQARQIEILEAQLREKDKSQ